MGYLTLLKDFLLGHDFLVSIVSSLLVSALIGAVVYQYTNLFKVPELSIVVKQDGFYRDMVLLSNGDNENYTAKFQFAVKNNGRKALKKEEGYWHIYAQTEAPTKLDAPGENNHKRGLFEYPVYSGSFLDLDLVLNLNIKKAALGNYKINYFFETDYGYYPNGIVVDPKTGGVPVKDMGLLGFELPK